MDNVAVAPAPQQAQPTFNEFMQSRQAEQPWQADPKWTDSFCHKIGDRMRELEERQSRKRAAGEGYSGGSQPQDQVKVMSEGEESQIVVAPFPCAGFVVPQSRPAQTVARSSTPNPGPVMPVPELDISTLSLQDRKEVEKEILGSFSKVEAGGPTGLSEPSSNELRRMVRGVD